MAPVKHAMETTKINVIHVYPIKTEIITHLLIHVIVK